MQLISGKRFRESSSNYTQLPSAIGLFDSEEEFWIKGINIFSSSTMDEWGKYEAYEEEEFSLFLGISVKLEYLSALYKLNNETAVKGFLAQNSLLGELLEILFEIRKQVIIIFKDTVVETCLEYRKDPEEGSEGLFVIMKTNVDPRSSLELLEKLDEEWWLDLDAQIRRQITLMVNPA